MNQFTVGDKVRRIRDCHMGMKVGDIATITKIGGTNNIVLREFGGTHDGKNFEKINNPCAAPVTSCSDFADAYNYSYQNLVNYYTSNLQPIKKPFMKKLGNMMKKLLSSDTQELVKAGYINGDLDLTSEGKEALWSILFSLNQPALVDMAKEANIEAEKNK